MKVLAALLLFTACDDASIDPITRITAPRVLAIVTEPSALPLDGDVALAALTVDPDGPREVDAVRMRACAPWKFISDPGRDCTGADALPLQVDADGRAVTSAAELSAAFPSPPGVSAPPDPWRAALAAGLELRVPIIAEVDVGGQTLVARRDVSVVETSLQRQNPRIAQIRFDGAATPILRAGQRYVLTVVFDRTSLDEDPDVGMSDALENVTCNFYSSSGDIAESEASVDDRDVPAPETTPSAYTAGSPGTSWLFVVATDETGGMSMTSVALTID